MPPTVTAAPQCLVAPAPASFPHHCRGHNGERLVRTPHLLAPNSYFVGGLGYNPRKHLERNPHVAVVVCAVRVYMWGCACREEQKQPTDE